MADAISIQELIDARTDAKTLEEAVNGDAVTTVLSRLGETYPTLSNALNQIDGQISDANDMLVESVTTLFTNGGLPATPFKTKALMTASALIDGKYAQVTDDTVNNGLYVKTAGTWVKSAYDPLLNANDYTNNLFEGISSYIFTDDGGVALAVTSLDGSVLMHITSDGKLFLAGDETSIADRISGIETSVADRISGIEHNVNANDGLALVEVKDAKGDHILAIDRQAQIYVGEDHLSLQEQIKGSGGTGLLALKLSTMDKSEGRDLIANNAMSVFHDKSIKTLNIVEPFPEIRRMIQRIPAALPLEGNKLLYMWGGGQGHPYNGDAEGVVMYKRILTYSDDGEILDNGVKEEVRRTQTEAGIAKHPMLGRTQAGRIILMWDEREGRWEQGVVNYSTMVAFSDDEGVSFTEPVVVPMRPDVTSQVVGSTGAIVTLSTGRLVCPMYHSDEKGVSLMYSDDEGLNWSYSSNIVIAMTLNGQPYHGSAQEPSLTADEDDVLYLSCRHNNGYHKSFLLLKSVDMGESIVEEWDYNPDLNGYGTQNSIYYDKDTGIMIQSGSTGQSFPTQIRDVYRMKLSGDKGKTWKIAYAPFKDDYYVGYNQVLKINENLYAVCFEGMHSPANVNVRENVGIFIFNLKEVFNNVVNS